MVDSIQILLQQAFQAKSILPQAQESYQPKRPGNTLLVIRLRMIASVYQQLILFYKLFY